MFTHSTQFNLKNLSNFVDLLGSQAISIFQYAQNLFKNCIRRLFSVHANDTVRLRLSHFLISCVHTVVEIRASQLQTIILIGAVLSAEGFLGG